MVVANYAPAYTWGLPIADVAGSCKGMCKTLYWKLLNQTWQMRPPWEIGPLIPSPFGGRNSQVWLYPVGNPLNNNSDNNNLEHSENL